VSQAPATITIEVSQPITVQNATLFKCYQTGGINYDLTEAQSQITTATGVTFSYYLNVADANAGNTNTIATPTSFNSAGNQTIYVLVVNGGCRYVVNLQLLATPQTTLSIAQPQQVTCNTPQITLNASASVIPAGSTIAWTTTGGGNIVSGANTLTPVVNAGGVYTLTVSNVNQPGNLNCSYTSNVTVTQNTTLPVATLTSTVQQICPGESVTLTASGGATYNWTTLTGNGNTQVVSPANTTVYQVYAVGANGCVSANPATITIVVGPPVAILAASKSKICAGESVTLTATGGVTYEWIGLPGNGSTQVVSPTATTTYSVFALGGNGCKVQNPTSITIEVVPAIESTLKDVYACVGDSGILDAGSGPNYTYLWNTGATTQTISVNTPGTYSVTISNGTCSKVFSAQLINPTLPQFTNVTYENHILTISATNPTGGELEYSSNGGVTWQASNIFYNMLDNNNYTLMVRVKDAKCGTTLSFFTFVVINAITPNSDGKNDTVDFSGISKYNNFAASIFDRYGQEVFKASKNETSWNGLLRGSLVLPTATYWYRVQWENPASRKLELRSGWILLKNRN
jgi:gliding motility-associated-like protein